MATITKVSNKKSYTTVLIEGINNATTQFAVLCNRSIRNDGTVLHTDAKAGNREKHCIYDSIRWVKLVAKCMTVPIWKIWDPDRIDMPGNRLPTLPEQIKL